MHTFRHLQDITLKSSLSDVVSKENKKIDLAAEVSLPDRPAVWLKDGEPIVESKRIKIETDSTTHRLIIASAQPQDQGEYKLLVDYLHTSANITVQGEYK